MNEDQELSLRLKQMVDQLTQHQQVAAMRGRMIVSMFSEGLQIVLQAARAGDPGAQSDLKVLRDLLQSVDDSGNEPRARITVVRRPEN